MKFAQKVQDEAQLANVISQFGTWLEIKQRGLKDAAPEMSECVAEDQRPEAEEQGAEEERPRRRKRLTPSLRRIYNFLDDIESADLNDTDLGLLSEIVQVAERHREAAIALAESALAA